MAASDAAGHPEAAVAKGPEEAHEAHTPSEVDGLKAALEAWGSSIAGLGSKYIELAMFEFRNVASATAVFIGLSVLLAVLVANAWIAGFAAVGLWIFNAPQLALQIATLCFLGASLGSLFCWRLRHAIRAEIKLSMIDIAASDRAADTTTPRKTLAKQTGANTQEANLENIENA